MGLLDLVKQQHAVRVLVDRVGQQPALIEADIARRRADEAAHRMPLHIFRHVETGQRNAEDAGELPRNLRLADAGGAGEQIVAERLVWLAKHGAAELDRRGQLFYLLLLPEARRRPRSHSTHYWASRLPAS